MPLSTVECEQCRLDLKQLRADYEGKADVPDAAMARVDELEAALNRECSSSSSSVAGWVIGGLLVLSGLLGFIFGRRE